MPTIFQWTEEIDIKVESLLDLQIWFRPVVWYPRGVPARFSCQLVDIQTEKYAKIKRSSSFVKQGLWDWPIKSVWSARDIRTLQHNIGQSVSHSIGHSLVYIWRYPFLLLQHSRIFIMGAGGRIVLRNCTILLCRVVVLVSWWQSAYSRQPR